MPRSQSDSATGGTLTADRPGDVSRRENSRDGIGRPTRPDRGGSIVPVLPALERRGPVFLLTMLSLVLTVPIFPRIGWWPLAYVCLVPWLLCVCRAGRSRFLYFVSYLFGVGYFAINAWWLMPVTLPGYIAFCLFFGLFMPLAAWPIRHLFNHRGVSASIAVPIVWTGIELLRSIGPLGFPMILLAHSQYRLQTVIQIADIVGAYGVTFMIAAVNGWFVDLMTQPIVLRRESRRPRMPLGTLFTASIVIATLIYGSAQKSERHLDKGPRIAVVQHDILQKVVPAAGQRFRSEDIFEAHLELARRAAVQEEKPDLIVMPESIIPWFYANEEFTSCDVDELEYIRQRRYARSELSNLRMAQEFSRRVREAFQEICDASGISIVLGAGGLIANRSSIPPGVDAFNASYLLVPNESAPKARYDKRHLVMIGEYVPFRRSWPAAYRWINSLSPYGGEGNDYSMSPGESFVPFPFEGGSPRRTFRAGTPICYEEIMPYIPRGFAAADVSSDGEKSIDVLLCMSNDGWFYHSSELEQHLAAGVFRAVENRIAVARSVNTGASALVDPNGRIHRRVTLPDEKIAKLPAVENALGDIAAMLEALRANATSGEALAAARRDIGDLVNRSLRPAYEALGPEFVLYADRIAGMKSSLSSTNPLVAASLDSMIEQVDEDIAMVRRWRDRPTTAPGIAAATVRIDPRLTLYTRWGDWFAWAMLVASGLSVLDWAVQRIVRKRRSAAAMEGDAHAAA